ncbi:MAG: hypothetical protein J4G18_15215 [Anaerolineae bacterium]|nr:hypothetical protein [Anaerolineae bacterium]
MPDSPAEGLSRAPLSEVIFILLQHFRASIAEAGLNLGHDEARELAGAIAAGQWHAKADSATQRIAEIVDSRLAELQSRWQIDFPTSLRADMTAIGPWRSTAEFLELANDKAEAETDIALGSALLAAAGRRDYAPYLLDALEFDAGGFDIDGAIARRILLHISGVDGARADWLAQVRRWLDDQPPRL